MRAQTEVRSDENLPLAFSRDPVTVVCGAQTTMLPFRVPAAFKRQCFGLCATDRGEGPKKVKVKPQKAIALRKIRKKISEFGAVSQVARIAEAGNDVTKLVQFFI